VHLGECQGAGPKGLLVNLNLRNICQLHLYTMLLITLACAVVVVMWY